jgi:uncharacterized protein (TIGR02001 family)
MMRLMLGAAAALVMTAGQAAADGMPTYGKAKAPEAEGRPCSISANTGFSTEKVIRGISESLEEFAVEGGFDLTCGRFYASAAGSSVNVGRASALIDLSAGIRPKTGPITWDLGVIYHAYNAHENFLNFVELKAAASGDVWKGGTLGASVLYAPEYGGLVGGVIALLTGSSTEAWTVEGTFAQTLPNVGIFTPTVSAAVGQVNLEDISGEYVYWNVGLTLGFHEKWAVDLRYSDTDISGGCAGICDGRFLAALKYTF